MSDTIYRVDAIPVEVDFATLPVVEQLQECLRKFTEAKEFAGGGVVRDTLSAYGVRNRVAPLGSIPSESTMRARMVDVKVAPRSESTGLPANQHRNDLAAPSSRAAESGVGGQAVGPATTEATK